MSSSRGTTLRRRLGTVILPLVGLSILALAARVPMTMRDFHVPGTQMGDVNPAFFETSQNCAMCHGNFDPLNEPYRPWAGSLMGQAGRDPLFFAQMTNANQDVDNVGYYCMRCHVPMSIVTGHAAEPSGATMDAVDRDGVSCKLCHTMVDPIYRPGVSPPEDQAILAVMADLPQYYGNAMFVLDPNALRRGPYDDPFSPHDAIYSSFLKTSEFCGTCHDVGNVAVTRAADGTYAYNAFDQPSPTTDPHGQFPLERTYTEWKLSAFASGGVDMGGRFGGAGASVVQTCQDCHMPRFSGQGCFFGPERPDLARHDFSGSAAWVLEIIGLHYQNSPEVNQAALAAGRQRAISMLERAASLELDQLGPTLHVRVVNETGHKLPTGHIEGRRAWLNLRFFDAAGQLLREFGHYDHQEAELDEQGIPVYEMKIGLSPAAAAAVGLPAGETTHMSLADVIVKDTRIPPRGFNNAAYEAAGAPAVAADYADGQYWHDAYFSIPAGAARAEATANYQIVTRHYIEALHEGNATDAWGQILHDLWLQTDRAPPVAMATAALSITPVVRGDMDCDGALTNFDIDPFVLALVDASAYAAAYPGCRRNHGDINGNGRMDNFDIDPFVDCLLWGCQ